MGGVPNGYLAGYPLVVHLQTTYLMNKRRSVAVFGADGAQMACYAKDKSETDGFPCRKRFCQVFLHLAL